MALNITNNPFDMVLKAFHRLYPDKKAHIFFDPDIITPENDEEGYYGCIVFPDESNEVPVIFISTEVKIENAVEILAHELAHLVIGPTPEGEEHGEEWDKIFSSISDMYETIGAEILESVSS